MQVSESIYILYKKKIQFAVFPKTAGPDFKRSIYTTDIICVYYERKVRVYDYKLIKIIFP